MTPSKTDLVELTRADRLVQIKRQVEQAVVDLQGRQRKLPGQFRVRRLTGATSHRGRLFCIPTKS
jgi:hypothetical protein